MNAPGTPDRVIQLSRVFAARSKLVFTAWTDPLQVARWIDSAGFALSQVSMEIAPGETWQVALLGPYGPLLPSGVLKLEVSPPDKLAFTSGTGDLWSGATCEVTATVTPARRHTTLTVYLRIEPVEAWSPADRATVCARGEATFDALSRYLAGRTTG